VTEDAVCENSCQEDATVEVVLDDGLEDVRHAGLVCCVNREKRQVQVWFLLRIINHSAEDDVRGSSEALLLGVRR